MKRKATFLLIGIFSIVAIILSGCSALSPSNPSATPSTGSTLTSNPTTTQSSNPTQANSSGQLEVRVTDAPPQPDVTSVMVTVSSVEVHQIGGNASPTVTANATATPTTTPTLTTTASAAFEQNHGNGNGKGNGQGQDQNQPEQSSQSNDDNSGWISLAVSGNSTFDLLKVKGMEQMLAVSSLQPGTYTQIRMEVSKVQVALNGGALQDATIPSGKLKFVQSFEIAAGKDTVLLFDFDAAKSVNITGNDKIMFKPVIKLSVTKTPGKMQITTPSLTNGEVGVSCNTTLAAIGGTLPYSWKLATGSSLPAGLALNGTTGAITGTPTTAGDFTFTVQVEDSSAVKKSDTKSFTINIAAAGTLQITTTSLVDGTKNVVYNATVQSVGGTGPFTWTISAGSLPAGLALEAATGIISGTPTANGDSNFTVKVTDSQTPTANTDSQNLTVNIAEVPSGS